MNNKHILDLTLRLSQSLDQNYDVVNMDTVLSVITALEGTTITKEQLEATRLAKYINQLRRRTKCENLARRAKSLLKKWREMVGIQQTNESLAGATTAINVSSSSNNNISSTPVASIYTMPVTDNAMTTPHLPNELSHTQYQRQSQYQSDVKPTYVQQQQPYHSQPSSPVNLIEKSNPNEFLFSMSNPATSQLPRSSSTNVRKKKRLEKELITQQQIQPTSFANLLTGLSSGTISSTRKVSREKSETFPSSLKPVETFVIEHSSNSNSDLICLPSNNSNYTSANDVPPVVIDLQDTNSSINSLVSKDITNTPTMCKAKTIAKKSKKEKKRKERTAISRQNQPLQDCDDQNTTPSSYQNKRTSNVLLLDEKSHSACPTISNISEILSLSNSSMSSVFPSIDVISKNNFLPALKNEVISPSENISKTELSFAGKFKQNTSTSSTCNILSYNSDSTNVNILSNNSSDQKKISLFGIGGIGNNSNDSTSNSRTSQFNVVTAEAARQEASNSKYNIEDVSLKHISEKSMSNMSNKGNSSTDNTFTVGALNISNTQQQSIDLTTVDYPSEQNVKQPKKRGRKKGSKGVDSVIAKETSLSSQMLISSLSIAGKKVKTTKELYAEMENRKLRNVKGDVAGPNSSANWTSQTQPKPIISRRASYFSDVAESDSCTMTSEPSRDSGNTKNLVKLETPLDNSSNFSKNDTELTKTTTIDPNSTMAITTKIKQEIEEFIKLLSPTPNITDIENECLKNLIPCTCTIEEVVAPTETETVVNGCDGETNNSTDSNFNVNNKKESDHMKTEQIKNEIETIKSEEKEQQHNLPQTKTPAKVKKSIFDLDFDEDEDPLNSIIADIAGKKQTTENDNLKTMPVVVEDMPFKIDDDITKVEQHNGVESVPIPSNIEEFTVFPSYEVKYDPNCKAKNRFEVQTQKITKFHIDTLHNCFIPNVNGNWNHADIVKPNSIGGTFVKTEKLDMDLDSQDHHLTSDGYDVVPFYSSDITEQIAKDLSHVQFTKNFKVKESKCKNEILFHIPFLGVSRIPEDMDINMQMNEYLNLEEEKENINDQLSLNNKFSTSALDVNDGSSDDAKDRESEQNINDSSIKNIKLLKFKRTKKNTTLIKRSANKRLKLKEKEDATNFDTDSEHSGEGSCISDVDDGNSDLNKLDFNNDNVTTFGETLGDDIPKNIVYSINNSKPNSHLSQHSKNVMESNVSQQVGDNDLLEDKVNFAAGVNGRRQKRLRKKLIKRKGRTISSTQNKTHSKTHNNLFYREEICPIFQFGTNTYRGSIFQISSCSSDCSEGEEIPKGKNVIRHRTMSSSSTSSNSSESSNNKYEGQMLNLQKSIIQSELAKRRNINKIEDLNSEICKNEDDKTNLVNSYSNIDDDIPEENNGLLLSFNNIYHKSTREHTNTDQNFDQQKPENKDHENMLKQQLQKCDDYNNLNNNFNLIKYIDNKTSTVNNNNNNSFSNSYSDTNIISISSSSSSCNAEKPTNSSATPSLLSSNCKNLNNNNGNYKNNDNVQNIEPFKEYQTGLRAVDEDVNDEDGNNCGRLQQFKEWHEVLQLRSYNDELLTVLPYVVLE